MILRIIFYNMLQINKISNRFMANNNEQMYDEQLGELFIKACYEINHKNTGRTNCKITEYFYKIVAIHDKYCIFGKKFNDMQINDFVKYFIFQTPSFCCDHKDSDCIVYHQQIFSEDSRYWNAILKFIKNNKINSYTMHKIIKVCYLNTQSSPFASAIIGIFIEKNPNNYFQLDHLVEFPRKLQNYILEKGLLSDCTSESLFKILKKNARKLYPDIMCHIIGKHIADKVININYIKNAIKYFHFDDLMQVINATNYFIFNDCMFKLICETNLDRVKKIKFFIDNKIVPTVTHFTAIINAITAHKKYDDEWVIFSKIHYNYMTHHNTCDILVKCIEIFIDNGFILTYEQFLQCVKRNVFISNKYANLFDYKYDHRYFDIYFENALEKTKKIRRNHCRIIRQKDTLHDFCNKYQVNIVPSMEILENMYMIGLYQSAEKIRVKLKETIPTTKCLENILNQHCKFHNSIETIEHLINVGCVQSKYCAYLFLVKFCCVWPPLFTDRIRKSFLCDDDITKLNSALHIGLISREFNSFFLENGDELNKREKIKSCEEQNKLHTKQIKPQVEEKISKLQTSKSFSDIPLDFNFHATIYSTLSETLINELNIKDKNINFFDLIIAILNYLILKNKINMNQIILDGSNCVCMPISSINCNKTQKIDKVYMNDIQQWIYTTINDKTNHGAAIKKKFNKINNCTLSKTFNTIAFGNKKRLTQKN